VRAGSERRIHQRLAGGRACAAQVLDRGRSWVERQDPASRRGVAIDAWRRYRAIDGPLQSVLLALYILIAVLPALLVMDVVYFVWAPRLLTHRLVSRRDLFLGALLTALGLVVLMMISSFVMEIWVDLYARDYGGLGVVMAIFFWICFSSFVIVAAASLSPALAERRTMRAFLRAPRD
jgi:uncharacterized BrkB/YihY/UPF0761 family membrane protein